MLKRMRKIPTWIVSLLVGFLSVTVIFLTSGNYGLAADEWWHARMGSFNAEWILNPSFATIDKYWPIDDKHPPLVKVIGALSRVLFTDTLHITDWLSAYRLAALPFVFLLSFMVTSFMTQRYSIPIGLFAGLSVIFLPRVFFDAHLGALDFPVTALWTATVIAATRGASSKRWRIASLIFTGLALVTKLQGFFLYALMIVYWALQRKVGRVIATVVVPFVVFIALWPWLWPNPISRFSYYASLITGRATIEVYYLGQTFNTSFSNLTPWHYPFVMTLVTLPTIILILFLIGLGFILVSPRTNERFLLVNALLPLAIMALPNALKYDGVRLFLPAMPFIVIIAGVAIHRLPRGATALSIITLIWVLVSTFRIHPYQMAYYNELVGGLSGALARGFETEYWSTSYKDVTSFIADHPRDWFCVYPWPDQMERYKELGMIPKEVVLLKSGNCKYLVLLSRQGFFYVDPYYWDMYKTGTPVFSVQRDNVSLVSVYRLR